MLNQARSDLAKQELHETAKELDMFWNRRTHRKLYVQTTRWNLRKYVRLYLGIIAPQHLLDPRHMAEGKTLYERRFELPFKWPRFWKGGILIADLEDLEMMYASDIYRRSIEVKEVLICQKDDEFFLPLAGGTATLSGRVRIPSTHSKAGTSCK